MEFGTLREERTWYVERNYEERPDIGVRSGVSSNDVLEAFISCRYPTGADELAAKLPLFSPFHDSRLQILPLPPLQPLCNLFLTLPPQPYSPNQNRKANHSDPSQPSHSSYQRMGIVVIGRGALWMEWKWGGWNRGVSGGDVRGCKGRGKGEGKAAGGVVREGGRCGVRRG